MKCAMSSSSRPPRSRYRFGFKGKRSHRNPHAATTDETLDSLTRQARLMEGDAKDRTRGLQTILEVESDEDRFQPWNREAAEAFKRSKERNFGKYAFGAMLIGGLTFLWIYSRLSEYLDLRSLTSLHEVISRVGFADWQKMALIAFCAFIIALIARRSRQGIRSRMFSAA